jgi:nucleoside-triphosphatase THEP1
MLGYLVPVGRGEGDRLLAEVAADLVTRGVPVAGAVQLNIDTDPDRRCHMDLSLIGEDKRVRISQERGKHASGCRLDPQGLVDAVHRVEAALRGRSAALVIINKFGARECEGGGFRAVIGEALAAGIPVLTTVSHGHLADFLAFAGGMAQEIAPTHDQAVAWCLAQGAA